MGENENIFNIAIENIVQYPFHMQDNLRVLYVIKGSLKMVVVSGEWILNENDIEIININEPIQIKKDSDENLVLILSIKSSFAKAHCPDIDKHTYNCNCTAFFNSVASEKKQRILKDKLYNICEVYLDGNNQYAIENQLADITSFIVNQFNDIKNIFDNYNNNDIHMLRFLGINDYLTGNFMKRITLNEIANIKYLSPQYLSGEFSNRLNRSFHSIVDYYRIIESVRLLIKTDLTITVISQQCGFSAIRYFYRHFKHYMHCTPTEFKKELTQKFIITESHSIKSKEIWKKIKYKLNKYAKQTNKTKILISVEDLDNISGKKHFKPLPLSFDIAKGLLINKRAGDKTFINQIRHKSYDSNCFASIILKRVFKGMDISKDILFRDLDSSTFLSGQKGIFTKDNIKKPLFWALDFVSRLSKIVVELNNNYIITKNKDGIYTILAVNCKESDIEKTIKLYDSQEAEVILDIDITLNNIFDKKYIISIEQIDNKSASLLKYINDVGKDIKISTNQHKLLDRYLTPSLNIGLKNKDDNKINVELSPFSFALITIEPF